MKPDCQRWASLTDLVAVGEPLPSDGPAFLAAHEASCAECAEEARLFRGLGVAETEGPIDERQVEQLLLSAAHEDARRASSLRRWRGVAVVSGGVVACAAAVLLWFSSNRAPGPVAARGAPLSSSQPLTAPPSQPAAAQPSLPAPPEQNLAAACSEAVPGATVCLAPGARLGRRSLQGPHRELEVVRGHAVVSLQPQPAGTSFSLTTSSGKVTAVGTIFSVDVAEDGSAIARVVEGKVAVRGADDTPHLVRAGQALRLGEQQPTLLSAAERELELALLAPAGLGLGERGDSPSTEARGAPVRGEPPQGRNTLEYARSLRASGDLRGAVDVYRKIHAQDPGSPSGRAALVSLGDLLLSLHDGAGALRAFDSYLAGGGTLAQEAMFGRVRALRALNRPSEERRGIQRFLAAYPDAPQGRILRARLTALEK